VAVSTGRARETDRERVGRAFAELASRGYLLPFPAWEMCCSRCGWAEVRRQVGLDPDDEDATWTEGVKTVWWHAQGDSWAFAGDSGLMPHTEAFLDAMPDDEDEADAWFEAHVDEAEADTLVAMETEYATLLNPLHLHWLGDPDEIVAALRATGLRARRPDSDSECVAVFPTSARFEVEVDAEDVTLVLDGEATLLTPGDARRLARRLQEAARRAEALSLPRL
jgi:hypothetical protein